MGSLGCWGRAFTRARQGPPDFGYISHQGGLKSIVYVKVFVSDENDNPPQFYPREYSASLSAQSPPGTAVLRVRAHDPDQGPHGRLSYHILAGSSPPLFALDEHSGEDPAISRICLPPYPLPTCLNEVLPSFQLYCFLIHLCSLPPPRAVDSSLALGQTGQLCGAAGDWGSGWRGPAGRAPCPSQHQHCAWNPHTTHI